VSLERRIKFLDTTLLNLLCHAITICYGQPAGVTFRVQALNGDVGIPTRICVGRGGTNVTYYGELSSTRINQSKPLFMCVIDASCAVGFHFLNYWDQRTSPPPTRKKHRNQFRIVGCSLCCVARILIRGVAQPFMFRWYSNTLTCRVGPNTSTTINYNT
jgi:hypothetical protein